MKTLNYAGWLILVWTAAGFALSGFGQEVGWTSADTARVARKHGFYIGADLGITSIRPADTERNEQGISFRFSADGNDMGHGVFAGYWINDRVGLELEHRNFGAVDVTFDFEDPHDGTQGTGEASVDYSAVGVSLMLGFDPLRNVQVYGRAGTMFWTRAIESRFDIPGEPAIEGQVDEGGAGLYIGAGIDWRFEGRWHLRLQADRTAFDDDEIDMVGLALHYDFAGLLSGASR